MKSSQAIHVAHLPSDVSFRTLRPAIRQAQTQETDDPEVDEVGNPEIFHIFNELFITLMNLLTSDNFSDFQHFSSF